MKRILIWLCLLCLILPTVALANVEPDHPASLTLRLTEEGSGLQGATFELYRVADMTDQARFELLNGYDAGEIDINKIKSAQTWNDVATCFAGQIGQPDATAVTDEQGNAKFASVETGLYLVIGKPVEIGAWAYEFAPFMISVPGRTEDGEWIYDVVADVKHTRSLRTFDLHIVKVWKDEGYSKLRPTSIVVDLYCDGKWANTVELSAGNNWSHVFTKLESAHVWTVLEKNVPQGYVASYSEKDGALVITNTLTAPPTTPPDIPQTGLLWWPVPLLAVMGAALFIIGWAMRRKWRNEHDQA